METTLPAIAATMIAEIELLLSQWPLSLRSLRWLQSLERDALPTIVPEYKVSTLFLGTGTGPNSVEGSWSKGVFTLAFGSTTGKFSTVENFNYLYAKRGKTFNGYYDSFQLTTHRCCWWKHHLLRTLVPSTVQEADLQWDWYCTTINTSYTPNTKREDPSKNAIGHPVLT